MPRVQQEVKVERRLDARPPKTGPRAELIQALFTVVLWFTLVLVMQHKDKITAEIATWELGYCKFSGFAGQCEECQMVVSVEDSRLALPSSFNWNVNERFVYSYFDDKQILEGDMFSCCDTSTLSCCAFEILDDRASSFCDECKCASGNPMVTAQGETCVPAPWPCRFRTDNSYNVLEIEPGFDERLEVFESLQIAVSVLAAIATLCHPFSRRLFGHAMDDAISAMIKVLRTALGKDLVEDADGSGDADSDRDKGPLYDDDPDDNPFEHPLPPGAPARRFRVDDRFGNSSHALVETSPFERAYAIPGLLQPLEWSPLDTTRELAELSRLSREIDPRQRVKPGSVRDRAFRDVGQMSKSLEAVDWRSLREKHTGAPDQMTQTWSSFGTPSRTPVPLRTDLSLSCCLSPPQRPGRSRSCPGNERQAWSTPDNSRALNTPDIRGRTPDPHREGKAKMSPHLPDHVRLRSLPPGRNADKTPAGPGYLPDRKKAQKLFSDLDGFALFVRPDGRRAPPPPAKGAPSPAPPRSLPP